MAWRVICASSDSFSFKHARYLRGTLMKRLALATVAALSVQATVAVAQSPQKPPVRSIESVRLDCIKTSGEAVWCDRVAEQARSRYGVEVTPREWQSSVGVIRARAAQGKYN
jgi:hypothetical protein